MTIEINKMVTLSYILKMDNVEGDVIEQTSDESPLKFVYGVGSMLPMFESNLAGKKQGEDFEMQLKATDAYGEIDETAIVDLSKEIFMVDGQFDSERFSAGAQIPMQTSTGQRMNGIIMEVSDENIKMDFNHPLAGKDLYFTGKVIEVRDATAEELAPKGCGCGSDGCSDDSCSTESCGCDSGSCGC